MTTAGEHDNPMIDLDFEFDETAALVRNLGTRVQADRIASAIVDKVRRGRSLSEPELSYLREAVGMPV